MIVPGALARTGAAATLTVEYANTGTAAMAAPLLRLQSADPTNDEFPILSLDQSGLAAGLWTEGVRDGFGRSVQILASGASPGILNPGERFSIPVAYVGLEQPWINDGRI